MLFTISIVEKHGFMKFDFFMYAEETDFCYRMRKFGIESIIVTTSIVMHKNEGSTNVYPQLKKIPVYYRRRNAMRFSLEQFNLSRWKVLSYPDGIITNLKTILKGIFSKNKDLNYFYALGSLHAFLGKKGKTVKPEKLIH
jgi:GT2 family glycosyltransferase